jgi:hypothetical protein
MPTFDIDVTDQDIKLGVAGDGAFCPIALVLRRISEQQFGKTPDQKPWGVWVGRSAGIVFDGNVTHHFDLDEDGDTFTSYFDMGRSVSPCKLKATVREVAGK